MRFVTGGAGMMVDGQNVLTGSSVTNISADAIVGGLTTNIIVNVPSGTQTLFFTNGILRGGAMKVLLSQFILTPTEPAVLAQPDTDNAIYALMQDGKKSKSPRNDQKVHSTAAGTRNGSGVLALTGGKGCGKSHMSSVKCIKLIPVAYEEMLHCAAALLLLSTLNSQLAPVVRAGVLLPAYAFNNPPDGNTPQASLAVGGDGNLYGTTYYSGAFSDGVVFRLTTSEVYSLLASFDGTNGANPSGALARGLDGKRSIWNRSWSRNKLKAERFGSAPWKYLH